ncbi:hypothetical protein CF326_g9262 [Tilletia indica]|nr:hypothetical protein CF326_g9262 [Tilletia indica]
MSNYAELEVQPFCELTPANVKVIQAHGLRYWWPDQDYNFDTIYPRLFSHEHSPAASLLQGLLEDPDDISIELRGAGPYGPKGEAILAQVAFMHLSKRSPRTDVALLRRISVYAVPELAILLLKLDAGFDNATARRTLFRGALYGRLTFPLDDGSSGCS